MMNQIKLTIFLFHKKTLFKLYILNNVRLIEYLIFNLKKKWFIETIILLFGIIYLGLFF